MVIGTDFTGSCKSNYHTTTTDPPHRGETSMDYLKISTVMNTVLIVYGCIYCDSLTVKNVGEVEGGQVAV